MKLREFLVNLLLRTPQEILVALLRGLLFLLILLLVLLLKLWEWLRWLFKTKTLKPEESGDDCGKVPEVVTRRPDPCIYSQSYLSSQGLPVTWNNPDIWVAPAANPGAVEPDSYHLLADTDYIVSVRVHNASTDPAIGVRVRLVYRPWSFNSPDVTPVETDAAGNEVIRSVDVAGMGSSITQFNWHTPTVAPGEEEHFCLQALLSHPLDANVANNVGQENTNVHSQNPGFVSPGEIALLDVPLFNVGRKERTMTFVLDSYQVDEDDRVELTLETAHASPRMPASDRVGHFLPTVEPPDVRAPREGGPIERAANEPRRREAIFGRIVFNTPKSRFRMEKTRYAGFEELRNAILDRDYSLPAGMDVVDPGPVQLRATGTQLTTFQIKVPDDAVPGTRLPVNIRAEGEDGALVGGVTIFFDVRP